MFALANHERGQCSILRIVRREDSHMYFLFAAEEHSAEVARSMEPVGVEARESSMMPSLVSSQKRMQS